MGDRSLFLACTLLLAGVLGCHDSHAGSPQTGSESHFLAECALQSECGAELTCLQGRCTRACDDADACQSLSALSTCVHGICDIISSEETEPDVVTPAARAPLGSGTPALTSVAAAPTTPTKPAPAATTPAPKEVSPTTSVTTPDSPPAVGSEQQPTPAVGEPQASNPAVGSCEPAATPGWVIETLDDGLLAHLDVHIAVAGDGSVHISYADRLSVRYAVHGPDGWTIETLATVSSDANLLESVGFALGADGTPHLCYVAADGLHYRSRSQAGWSDELVQPGVHATGLGAGCLLAGASSGELRMLAGAFDLRREGFTWSVIAPTPYGLGVGPSWTVGGTPGFALDSAGHAHVSASGSPLRYATDASGQWVETGFSDDIGGFATDSWSALAIDSLDDVHIVYSPRPMGSLLLTTLHGTGDRRALRLQGDQPERATAMPSIAIDADDRLHIAYLDDGMVAYRTDQPDAPSTSLAHDHSWWSAPVIALGPDGTRHIAYGATVIPYANLPAPGLLRYVRPGSCAAPP